MKLVLRNITKRFGSLVANDRISLEVLPGEVHCLLGENGAGKSTLMNVLYGLYRADEGEIVLDDVVQHFSGPGDAMAAGIGMVHQHFMLIPVFTVTENVMLGHESTGFAGTLDVDAARKRVQEISAEFGFHVNPDAIVEDLPVGVQQRVEIIKALSRDAKILVFDEPTAVLTPQETDELMDIMRQLKEAGKAIVFITHKLREVRAVADRITVIRRGAVVGEAEPSATNADLAALMVGRPVELTVHKDAPQLGDEALAVRDLRVVDALGQVRLDGMELVGRSVRQVLDAGVGFIPEDRQVDGLVGSFTIAENLMLNRSFRSPFVRRGTLRMDALEDFAEKKLKEYDVRARDIHTPAGKLSGGNQQKVVVARELSRDLRLLVAAQPTRGVDVGSIEFIHKQVIATRDSGIPVLVVSTELDEVVALADRIMVLYRGQVVGIVPGDTPRETLGLMMTGERPKDVVA
jgi:simple sugar transport system ATP-binding protein